MSLTMSKSLSLHIVCLIIIFLLSAAVASSQEKVIFSLSVGECKLSVEANDQWHTLRLRANDPEPKNCRFTKDEMVSALSAAFLKTEPPKLEGVYSSLFIGRLIDYPWLAHDLADAASHDKGWDATKGKPVATGINQYVSRVLFRKELLAPIEQVCAQGGYRIVGVTVEKVLVGGPREVPLYHGDMALGLVPYDAMVWFRLEKN
jgi:hypothetical protein